MSSKSSSSKTAAATSKKAKPTTKTNNNDNTIKISEDLKRLWDPHIDSFNFFLEEGIPLLVKSLLPQEVRFPKGEVLEFRVVEVQVGFPHKNDDLLKPLYPTESRQTKTTYAAPCNATIARTYNGSSEEVMQVDLGRLPIMVQSKKCNLYGMSAEKLVKHHEEAGESGGFFVINGSEKLIRMLQVPRANYVFGFTRQSYTTKGPNYTAYCAQIRCVGADRTAKVNTVHYLSTGAMNMRFAYKSGEFFIPVGLLLKAFHDGSDKEIYEKIVQGEYGNTFVTERVELLLSANRDYNVISQRQALAHLGKLFKPLVAPNSSASFQDIGSKLIERVAFIHLPSYYDKFELLVFMIQKVLGIVGGKIMLDNIDSPASQEVLLPGHIFCALFKQKLADFLSQTAVLLEKTTIRGRTANEYSDQLLRKSLAAAASIVSTGMNYLLTTGNIKVKEIVELPQLSGYSVVADRLNFLRYLSHFRSIHRGAFFAEMKTTTVRKLLPESWGFMCCVHTPDGAPCGLLNHLTSACVVAQDPPIQMTSLEALMGSMGMSQVGQSVVFPSSYLSVIVDGRIFGKLPLELASSFVARLRVLKIEGTMPSVPRYMEIAYIPPTDMGVYPGIFIFTSKARMMRPVISLATNKIEYIGSFEQVYMDIACIDEDMRTTTTHKETGPTHMLSVVANLTPFSDHNQSPRNMYQCQMAKQTMGTPYHAHPYRTDNKVYRIQHPQRPLVRNKAQEKYDINHYPHGANAVVAVISYTGYDMEDAMIINKSAYERGFGHASVYTTVWVNVVPENTDAREVGRYYLCRQPGREDVLDEDGLPYVGQTLNKGDVFYTYITEPQRIFSTKLFKYKESAVVENITIHTSLNGTNPGTRLQTVSIRLRFNRNPVIGDKFSSRHGQKGVLSQLWPEINMPFTESGMKPDCIINPHAFPSRMTIGMLIESMAGKAGACHGFFQDSTPFQFDEKNTAADYFGEQLSKAGYNYYGNEPMYSGITGQEFHADIYIGVVYYQRLRHMVKDKFQVRSTGPINRMTRQPVKGRKVGGGIRFGEMERDSLLAHGASHLLLDRLMNCSDYSKTFACKKCGSILTPTAEYNTITQLRHAYCNFCKSDSAITTIAIPYVFRFLAAELACVNIRTTLEIK